MPDAASIRHEQERDDRGHEALAARTTPELRSSPLESLREAQAKDKQLSDHIVRRGEPSAPANPIDLTVDGWALLDERLADMHSTLLRIEALTALIVSQTARRDEVADAIGTLSRDGVGR